MKRRRLERARERSGEGLRPVTDEIHELGARFRIGFEDAAQRTRDGKRVLLLDAAHHHTEVFRFDDDSDTARVQDRLDRLGDIHGQSFLDLKPSSENLDRTRNLR